MKLYIIAKSPDETSTALLKKACEARNIDHEILIPLETNPSSITIKSGDAVYRTATSSNYGAAELERDLIMKGAKSFRSPEEAFIMQKDETLLFREHNIPTPKTITYLPKDKTALKKCVEEVGGFPVCVKMLGGSHGAGVMRIDGLQSLISVSDYLRASGKPVVMKEYCDVTSTARLIVLGDKVIDSIEYTAPEGDFRSNEGIKPNVSPKTFNQEVNNVAVSAVKALGLEFGGVDIMVTKNGPKVAEVNSPCFFPRCQLLTGTDIAGQMVEYLIKK